jgi:hypothetical protein
LHDGDARQHGKSWIARIGWRGQFEQFCAIDAQISRATGIAIV